MTASTFRLSALSAALLSTAPAWAIGFGDIVLHSRIGEPLRAEVPITAEADESLETTCFSLAPMNGSDLPVISSAKTRLVREGDRYRLHITGSKPVSEPIFLIGLRAGCGIDLQRDYVLTPAEPLALPGPPPAAATTHGGTRSRGAAIQEWRASEGDTLESIAETLARHIEESASDNPRPWLMLLDLYRRGGLSGEYTRLLPGLRQKFNLQAPDWQDLQTPATGLRSLEDYAHVASRITALWGTQECMDYLYQLVHDNRDGQRSGFPLEVVEEIVLLLLVLEAGYGLQRQR